MTIPAMFIIFEKSKIINDRKKVEWLTPFAGFLVGFLVYLSIFKIFTGDSWAGFNAQSYFAAKNSIQNLFHPFTAVINDFFNKSSSFNNPTDGMLSRFCFVGFLVFVFFAWKNLDKPLLAYSLVMGLISAFSGNLTSYPRYLEIIFPLFILISVKIKDKVPFYLAICIPLQIIFILFYSINEWVA